MDFKTAKKIASLVSVAEHWKGKLDEINESIKDTSFDDQEHYGLSSEVVLENVEAHFEEAKKDIKDFGNAS